MKFSKLIVYLAVFIALAAYVYLVEIKHKEKTRAAEEKAQRIVDLKKDDIVTIQLGPAGQDKIELTKAAGQWVVTAPVKTKADDREVDTFLHSVTDAKSERVIAEKDVKWEEYGLDKPSFTVGLGTKDGVTDVSFGDANPARTSYYVRVGDKPQLLLVVDTLKNGLNKTAFDLRDKTVVAMAPADIDRFIMTKEGKQVELKRESPELWRMVAPESMRAKRSAIENQLRALTGLKARKIIDTPSETGDEYGLEKPDFAAVMAGKQREVTLEVGKPVGDEKAQPGAPPDRYARVKGDKTVYVIEGRILKGLVQDPEALRDRSLFAFDPQDVEKIKIELDGKTWEASRDKDKNWSLEQPVKKPKLETWLVTRLLWDLKDLEWKTAEKPASEDLAPHNLGKPQLTVTIVKKGDTGPVELKVGWEPKKPELGEGIGSATGSEPLPAPSDKTAPAAPEKPRRADVPETVNAMVQPHEDSGMVFTLSGNFIEKLEDGLNRLVAEKEEGMSAGK